MLNPHEHYVLGLDFGTDSVRSLLVDAADGREIAVAVVPYPAWREGRYCDLASHQFRQHPQDHLSSMREGVSACLAEAGPSIRRRVRAISVASTGSTPVAVDGNGQPLALQERFSEDPDAMFLLWKDHSAVLEAAELNAHARGWPTSFLDYAGGVYSPEWYWAKLLHILRRSDVLRTHSRGFVEHCDWIPFLLTGGRDVRTIRRSVCAAGHKALWSEAHGGYPDPTFFTALDPLLAPFALHPSHSVYTADQPAGVLCREWAECWQLPADTLIGIGALDAHMGAVGAQIEPFVLSKVMGTSTCDMLVAPASRLPSRPIRGICGLVNGSILPGLIGLEAGQSAFGDVYAWLRDLLAWSMKNSGLGDEAIQQIIPALASEAAALPVQEHSELALDWFNGRRTPDANPRVTGAITGLSLASDPPRIFRSLVEATAFGARAIVERFRLEKIPVKGIIATGGIARKSPYVMQTMADVLGLPVRVNRCDQTAALGAAMFAATVAGCYTRVEDAMSAMGRGFDPPYLPDLGRRSLYERRYTKYLQTGAFLENERA
jgi:L-ribulokinase